ncbi:MAG: glycosyltransferase [Bacteroidales bacterium]|nr:glycosyltransferase [Bacteroidales bacterium]
MEKNAAPEPSLAPVAMFVYNRADNTRRTLEALLSNTLAPQTELYVFSDGGKDETSWAAVKEVRAVLHEVEAEVSRARTLNKMTIVERPENFYLERNIIEGIGQVLSEHETVVVLEDDIVTAPHFLEFMNEAFDRYRNEKRVMHVSGFTRLEAPRPSDFYFSPFMAGWGWGTWRDRWQQHFRHFHSRSEALEGLTPDMLRQIEYGGVFPCLKDLDRKPIPWDICWTIALRRAGGLCLYPTRTLVRNIGLASGTHYGHLPQWAERLLWRYEYDRIPYEGRLHVTKEEPLSDPAVETAMTTALTDWGIRYTWFGQWIRTAYKRLSK